MNPGYFSHDEIGWGIKAISQSSLLNIEYYNLFHYDEFHYRPLNFNLWLFTSYYLFEIPQLYHFVLVFFGLINSTLLYFFIKKEVGYRIAFLTAITSTIMPTVVFVNGWIGTIADIFWFMFCIISLMIHQKNRISSRPRPIYLALSILLFIFSLMFKETAVVFPGILFIYIVYSRYKEQGDIKIYKNKCDVIVFILSTLIFLSYILVRFEFLFPNNGGGYGTSLTNVPFRMLEYFVYPFLIGNIEIHGLLIQHTLVELVTAFSMHVIFIVILCGKHIFRYFLYFSCYFVTSVPLLILDMSLPHYIYTSGFVIAFGVSILFYSNIYKKLLSVVFFSALAIHGINIQKNYMFTGEYQNNFVNTLYSQIKGGDKDCIYVVKPEVGSASWIAIRAIAFREAIGELTISNLVFFNESEVPDSMGKRHCYLSLDTSGRVVLTGGDNSVQ